MKAFRTLLLTVFAALAAVLLLPGCKKDKERHTNQENIAILVKAINQKGDTVLANGVVLTSCSYEVGDPDFVYNLMIPDNRFKDKSLEEVREEIDSTLLGPGAHGLLKALSRDSIGLVYICTGPENIDTIVFTPAEVKAMVARTSHK